MIINLWKFSYSRFDLYFQEHELYPQRANRKKILDIEFSFADTGAGGGNDRGRGRGGRGKIEILL